MKKNNSEERTLLWEEDFSWFERNFQWDFVKESINKRKEKIQLMQANDRINAVKEFERLKEATSLKDNPDYQPWIDIPSYRESRKKVMEVYSENTSLWESMKLQFLTLLITYISSWKISKDSRLWKWFSQWGDLIDDEEFTSTEEFHEELEAIMSSADFGDIWKLLWWIKHIPSTHSHVFEQWQVQYRESIVKAFEELLYQSIKFETMSTPEDVQKQFDRIIEEYHRNIDQQETPATDRILVLDGKKHLEEYKVLYDFQKNKIEESTVRLKKIREDAHRFTIESISQKASESEDLLIKLINESVLLENSWLSVSSSKEALIEQQEKNQKRLKKISWVKWKIQKYTDIINNERDFLQNVIESQFIDYKESHKWIIGVTDALLKTLKSKIDVDTYWEDIMEQENDLLSEWDTRIKWAESLERKFLDQQKFIEEELYTREKIVLMIEEEKNLRQWRKMITFTEPEEKWLNTNETRVRNYWEHIVNFLKTVESTYDVWYEQYADREKQWRDDCKQYDYYSRVVDSEIRKEKYYFSDIANEISGIDALVVRYTNYLESINTKLFKKHIWTLKWKFLKKKTTIEDPLYDDVNKLLIKREQELSITKNKLSQFILNENINDDTYENRLQELQSLFSDELKEYNELKESVETLKEKYSLIEKENKENGLRTIERTAKDTFVPLVIPSIEINSVDLIRDIVVDEVLGNITLHHDAFTLVSMVKNIGEEWMSKKQKEDFIWIIEHRIFEESPSSFVYSLSTIVKEYPFELSKTVQEKLLSDCLFFSEPSITSVHLTRDVVNILWGISDENRRTIWNNQYDLNAKWAILFIPIMLQIWLADFMSQEERLLLIEKEIASVDKHLTIKNWLLVDNFCFSRWLSSW